jgi:hypothetical protein
MTRRWFWPHGLHPGIRGFLEEAEVTFLGDLMAGHGLAHLVQVHARGGLWCRLELELGLVDTIVVTPINREADQVHITPTRETRPRTVGGRVLDALLGQPVDYAFIFPAERGSTAHLSHVAAALTDDVTQVIASAVDRAVAGLAGDLQRLHARFDALTPAPHARASSTCQMAIAEDVG